MTKFGNNALGGWVLVLLVAACGRSSGEDPVAPALGEPFAPDLLDHRTGIAACDSYVDSVNRCLIEKLPEDEKTPRLASMKQHLGRWLVRLEAPGASDNDRAAVATDCNRVATEQRAELSAKGCRP